MWHHLKLFEWSYAIVVMSHPGLDAPYSAISSIPANSEELRDTFQSVIQVYT